VNGWRRFQLAAATVLHHEIALALTALALVAFTWGQPNQTAALVFLALWALRLSAKFNLFLGAPYRSEEMLPPHLAHLASYFRRRRMNALLPVSLAVGAASAWMIGAAALQAQANALERTGGLLLVALIVLGLIEHVFMFLPPPNKLLWGWARQGRQERT
jgi:putative photosynthetic complex assembly protein 2